MKNDSLDAIRELIQEDIGNRGLRSRPDENLITACHGDFISACHSLAVSPNPRIAVVTGFLIPHGQPPAGETDGPLGALFLARALVPLGIAVVLATDEFCVPALKAGLAACGLRKQVPIVTLPNVQERGTPTSADYWQAFAEKAGVLTHLIAIERVGPSHTPESVAAQAGNPANAVQEFAWQVAAEHHNRCHTMKGRDITDLMSPAHLLFEAAKRQQVTTIGIGDGGNEIGMGKIPWEIIRSNITGGATVACRVPTDHLIVCGISNWGAYGLAAGVRVLRDQALGDDLFDPGREQQLLGMMVEQGPLVDGVSGQPTVSVDGIDFPRYAEKLTEIARILRG